MSDTDDSQEVDQSDEVEYVADDVDPMLETLVRLVNATPKMMVPVTLNVAGALVTGRLIGADDWCDQAADETDDPYGSQIYSKWGDALLQEESDTPPGHVHLRDAFFVQGTQHTPARDGFFWRGRLTEISGWTMARLR